MLNCVVTYRYTNKKSYDNIIEKNEAISKAVTEQQRRRDMKHNTSVASNTALATLGKPIADNITNLTPAFTTILKVGNLFAPLSGN